MKIELKKVEGYNLYSRGIYIDLGKLILAIGWCFGKSKGIKLIGIRRTSLWLWRLGIGYHVKSQNDH